MAEHRTARLKIYGDGAEVEKLINDRWRITVRCEPSNKVEDWFYANRGNTFAAFSSEMDDEILVGGVSQGWVAPSGQPWLNAKLIRHELGYTPTGDYVVTFIYETLTSSWVSSEGDRIGSTENGLRTLTRTQVAASGATKPYDEDDVGVSTITDGGKTLYLAGFEDQSDERMGTFVSQWAEAGVLSVIYDNDSPTSIVGVTCFALTEAQARAAVSEITANHSIKNADIGNYKGFQTIRYNFEIRATNTLTELGDTQIGVGIETGIQTDGTSDFIITREYSISSANAVASIVQLIPPAITDPVFDGASDSALTAYIVDQDLKPNGGAGSGAKLTRVFAMVPTPLTEWDEMVIRFPGVEKGPFQLAEDFPFRFEPYSEAVPVRICRTFYLSNPQRIPRPKEFRPVDENGNRVSVLTDDTVPTADEYIGYVNSGKYLIDRVSIHRWQGDIWERRIVSYRAE